MDEQQIPEAAVDVLVRLLRAALAGEPVIGPQAPDATAQLAAIRKVLLEDDPMVKAGAYHLIALAAIAGLNGRLRASVGCAKAIDSARLQ